MIAPDQIETWPLVALRPYERNAKHHPPEQIDKIAQSMEQFGWTVPILIDADGEIIAGHGRVMAAEQLNIKTAPVIILNHLTEKQQRAYRLADNKLTEIGGWNDELLSVELDDLANFDFDLESLGFDTADIDSLLADLNDDNESEETVPELFENPVSAIGDLWVLGNHRLLCGDCTNVNNVKRLMNGERAVLFATDPPYLMSYTGNDRPRNVDGNSKDKNWAKYGKTWDDADKNSDLYERFICTAVDIAIDERAAWYCWYSSKMQIKLEKEWEAFDAFVHQQIIWVKSPPTLTFSTYTWGHEPCFYGWVRGKKPKILQGRLGKESTTWHMKAINSNRAKDDIDHPTPKPLDAFGIPMRTHVPRGGLCYEPFSGSGSQIMAGEENDRRVYAVEIEPSYVDVAVQRWQNATGRDAVLDADGATFNQIKEHRHG